MRRKCFPSLWYPRRKRCTYLVSRFAQPLNRLKQVSTWARSPWSTIKCVRNDFWAYGTFGANHAYTLLDTNTVSKWTKTRFHMTHVTKEFNRVRQKRFLSLRYVSLKLCTYLVSRFELPQNGLKRASTWALSPRSTIGCVWNDFWAYGTFSANRAPILYQH